MKRFIDVTYQHNLRIKNAHVPVCCLPHNISVSDTTIDSLALVDIDVANGLVTGICAARGGSAYPDRDVAIVDLRHGMVLPTFVDLHTHIGELWHMSGLQLVNRPHLNLEITS